MRKSKHHCFILILLAFTLLHSACAQTPGQAYVNEERLAEKSTVLLNNDKYLIPLRDVGELKIASIRFSNRYATGFDSLLNKYAQVQTFIGGNYIRAKNIASLSTDLKLYNTLIIQVNDVDLNNPQIVNFIIANQTLKNVVVAFFGDGNNLNRLNDVRSPIIWCDRVTPVSAYYSAQAIFGGVAITQKLTRSYSQLYRASMGFLTEKTRLQYTVPEDAGINSANLQDIDKIAREAIAQHATPGCVVLVAKDGKVIFNKAYGYHTYDAEMPDKLTDIFDIASMTKVTATTMEAMRLYEQRKLALDSTVGNYLALAKNTNKNDLKVRELLTHQAGLVADIHTVEVVRPADHSTDSSAAYPTKVNNNYFLRKDYFKDVLWPTMLNSPLRTRGQYVYSDLSMVFMQQIEETITSTPLNTYVQQQFYTPLGMQTAGFLPLYRFSPDRIIPTEDEQEYRHSVLLGYVNDPTAALMGGVAGNAGVFASANDIAILYQMILNKGAYGGIQFFTQQTVDLFTAKQSPVSRRGLGFDRWDPELDHHYPSQLASPDSYGHTGYTGTCVWVDPKYNLVYIFLSNRTFPKVTLRLSNLNTRPRIQDVVYDAIGKGL